MTGGQKTPRPEPGGSGDGCDPASSTWAEIVRPRDCVNYAWLIAATCRLDVFIRSDGVLTCDRTEIELDVLRVSETEPTAIIQAGDALLRMPVRRPEGRRTPGRIEALERFVAAGLVPVDLVHDYLEAGIVSDAVWAGIRHLQSLVAPDPVGRWFWSLAMYDAEEYVVEEAGLELPAPWDPLEHPDFQGPPLLGIERMVDLLADEGLNAVKARWRVESLESLDRSEGEVECLQDLIADDDLSNITVVLERDRAAGSA